MTAIWYDPDCDQIWIQDRQMPFPPRTLVVTQDGDTIGIRIKDRAEYVLLGPYTMILDGAGRPFGSAGETRAYLAAVFARGANRALAPVPAAVPLGGHRVVWVGPAGVDYASSDNGDSAEAVLGITTGATDAGEIPDVLRAGTLREAAWAWIPGPVYLGLNGLLTQIAPSRGAVLQIASAVAATDIFVTIQEPYHLAS